MAIKYEKKLKLYTSEIWLRQKRLAGWTVEEIATLCRVDKSTISRHMEKFNIT